jgi:hypothetical protein
MVELGFDSAHLRPQKLQNLILAEVGLDLGDESGPEFWRSTLPFGGTRPTAGLKLGVVRVSRDAEPAPAQDA